MLIGPGRKVRKKVIVAPFKGITLITDLYLCTSPKFSPTAMLVKKILVLTGQTLNCSTTLLTIRDTGIISNHSRSMWTG